MGKPNGKHRSTVEAVRNTNVRIARVVSMAPLPRGNYHPPGEHEIWSLPLVGVALSFIFKLRRFLLYGHNYGGLDS